MNFLFAFYGQHAQSARKQAFSSPALENLPAFPDKQNRYCIDYPYFTGLASQDFGEKQAKLELLAQNAPIKIENGRFWCNSIEAISRSMNQLSGHFRFAFEIAISDPHQQNQQGLVLAVSAFNPHTIFYAQYPGYEHTYCICTHISPLLELLDNSINLQAISLWLAGRPNPNMCNYENIHQVAQGHLLVLPLNLTQAADHHNQMTQVNSHQFWDIDPNKSLCIPTEEATQRLIEILGTNVEHTLQAISAPVFTQLSGGMDSTSVSALAYQSLDHPSAQLHSISHTYKNTQSCDESDNIDAMIGQYKFAQSHFIELDKYAQLSFKALYPTHAQSPGMVLSPKYVEEAALLKQHGAALLLTGNGGDEMCWGHSFAYYDDFRSGNISILKEVYKSAKALNLSGLRTIKSVLLKPYVQFSLLPLLKLGHMAKQQALIDHGLTLPPWLTNKSAELVNQQQVTQLRRNPFADDQGNTPFGLAKYARYEGLFYTATFNSMRSYQAVFEPYGLQVAHPFFNKELAEFSFAIDQREHISGQYPKLLLRKAMHKHLPKQVCWNTHKTIFDQHFAKLVKQSRESLRELLSHEGLQDLGLVDNKVILTTFDNVVNQPQPSLNVDLLYAILVQSWYQTHILNV